MNILVIAPHPDDESIGCGGTLRIHAERGDRVAVAFLTSGELGLKRVSRDEAWAIREREAEAAAEVLGIASLSFLRCPDYCLKDVIDEAAAALCPILDREPPALAYLPHTGEGHPDHQASVPILLAALRHTDVPAPTLRTYEVWTPLPAYPAVEDITPVVKQKMRAIRCHRSQIEQYRYDRAIRGLNQYRGAFAAHCAYAEAFGTIGLETGRADL